MSPRAKYGLHYESPIFFDLETSGLDFNKHEIIQIAAINADTGEEFERKLMFDFDKAEPEALEINKYNRRVWKKEAVSQEQGLTDFNEFLGNNRSVTKKSNAGKEYSVAVLAGYNCNAFDRFFLIDTYKRLETFAIFDFRFLDVYPLVMWAFPNRKSYKLESVYRYLKFGKFESHDALEDVKATIKVAAFTLDYAFGGVNPSWVNKWYPDAIPF